MKKNTILLLALLGGLLSSCFKDDEVTFDNYCYISSVSLGTMKRVTHYTNAEGRDTTYRSSYSGNLFQMTIDQRTLKIENRDSLLYGTDLSAQLVSISFDGATLLYRPEADTTAEWTAYNSKDSMDLRQPLQLLVVSNDGASNRLYSMKLNVHQQEGDSLYWNRVDSNVVELGAMDDTRAMVYGQKLYVLGRTGSKWCMASRSLTVQQDAWSRKDTNLPDNADPTTLCLLNEVLYVSTAEGRLFSSVDAENWTCLTDMNVPNIRLAGASKSYLYAIADGRVLRSTDGQNWNPEALDDEASYLPDTCVSLLPFTLEDGSERLVMVGYRTSVQQDTAAVVWNKSWTAKENEANAEWVYFTQTWENHWFCPWLKDMNVLPYDGKCMAFGGASLKTGSHRAMDALFFSRDYGITWKPDYELYPPRALKGVDGSIAAAVDEDKYIWIIANQEVWRGRLNRLGFLRQ